MVSAGGDSPARDDRIQMGREERLFLMGWRWPRATDENTDIVRKVVSVHTVVGVVTRDWVCMGEIDLINILWTIEANQGRKICDVGLKLEVLVSPRFSVYVKPLFFYLEQF